MPTLLVVSVNLICTTNKTRQDILFDNTPQRQFWTNVQMQAVDNTVTSGLQWLASDQYGLLITVGGFGDSVTAVSSRFAETRFAEIRV